MRFTNKRGRPKSSISKAKQDLGTPELQAKKQSNITKEPLDLCYERNLINADQRWAGIHLRWLHTIRFGLPNVTSISFDLYDKFSKTENDEDWQQAREIEYKSAIKLLAQIEAKDIVLDICVFNRTARFLDKIQNVSNYSNSRIRHNERQIMLLQEGLQALVDVWN